MAWVQLVPRRCCFGLRTSGFSPNFFPHPHHGVEYWVSHAHILVDFGPTPLILSHSHLLPSATLLLFSRATPSFLLVCLCLHSFVIWICISLLVSANDLGSFFVMLYTNLCVFIFYAILLFLLYNILISYIYTYIHF